MKKTPTISNVVPQSVSRFASSEITISRLVRSLENNGINIPEFQRRFRADNGFAVNLIATILSPYNYIPPIILWDRGNADDVVDGQQRVLSIQNIVNDKVRFKINGRKGMFVFSDLDPDVQNEFLNYKISTRTYDTTVTTIQMRKIFSNVNQQSHAASAEEIARATCINRNGELVATVSDMLMENTSLTEDDDKKYQVWGHAAKIIALILNIDNKNTKTMLDNVCELKDAGASGNEQLINFARSFIHKMALVFGNSNALKTINADGSFEKVNRLMFVYYFKLLSSFNNLEVEMHNVVIRDMFVSAFSQCTTLMSKQEWKAEHHENMMRQIDVIINRVKSIY